MPILVLRMMTKTNGKSCSIGRAGLVEMTVHTKPYRERKAGERDLGDIPDGSVAAVGNQEHGRRKYLVAAANDGMVHIFQSTDGNNPGDLKVSYLPSAMERENDASGSPITLAKVLEDIAHAGIRKIH